MTDHILILYTAFFIAIAVIDWKNRIIPNRVIYPALPLALLLSVLIPTGMLAGMVFPGSLLMALLGGAIGFVCLFIPAWKFPGNMGMGDAKLAGLVGIVNGFPGVLLSLGIAFLTGGLAAVFVKKGDKSAGLPFGPFLCAGCLIVLFWGGDIINLCRSLG